MRSMAPEQPLLVEEKERRKWHDNSSGGDSGERRRIQLDKAPNY